MIRRPTLASILALSLMAPVLSGPRSALAQDPAPEIFADLPVPSPVPEETGSQPAESPPGVELTPSPASSEPGSLLDEAVIPAQAGRSACRCPTHQSARRDGKTGRWSGHGAPNRPRR